MRTLRFPFFVTSTYNMQRCSLIMLYMAPLVFFITGSPFDHLHLIPPTPPLTSGLSFYEFVCFEALQSCRTLCDPIDCSPPGSPVPGILQARTLEWVAISFSSAWKWKVKVKALSRVWLLATPWTAAHQAPPPMGFSRRECWNGCQRLLLTYNTVLVPDAQHADSVLLYISKCCQRAKALPYHWLYPPPCTFHPHDLFCSWKFVPLSLPCPLLSWL